MPQPLAVRFRRGDERWWRRGLNNDSDEETRRRGRKSDIGLGSGKEGGCSSRFPWTGVVACDPDLEKGRWSDDSATQKNEDDNGDTTRERGNMLRCEGDAC